MDLKTSNYHLPVEEVKVKAFDDPVCKLIPMANTNTKSSNVNVNIVEAPPTPGRPVFSFSIGSRKNFPSKWDDAQKWVITTPDSPSAAFLKPQQLHKTDEKKPIDSFHLLVKDKFTNNEEQHKFKCLVPMKDASTGCPPTPYKNTSPPRHNTPASMSGPLALMNGSSSPFDIEECHLAKLQQLDNSSSFDSVTCNWSSREEEEEDVSKSLRHFEINNECPKIDTKPCVWEQQEENTKFHLRYQREEAKIQAWVNLQKAKAEAQSRKLEVKIQKMTSKFEEKMMKKMEIVHRKAEELRAAAQHEHNMQLQKPSRKTKDLHESMHFPGSCGCFPCNNFHP